MNEQVTNNAIYRDREDFYRQLNESYDDIKVFNTTGGGGIIYSGIHKRLGQKVVLKKIRSNVKDSIKARAERNMLMNLKHTYLPQIVDFWSYGDEVYTVMEYIEGNSLKELLDSGRRFTQAEVIRMTRQLAEVLNYLHNSKSHIIHSDIKPANIMLTPEGNICLIDFNISVSQNGDVDETIGYTVGYAPVEQIIRAEENRRRKKEASVANDKKAKISVVADNDDDITKIEFDSDLTRIEFDDKTRIDFNTDVTNIDTDDDATTISDDRTAIDFDEDVTNIDLNASVLAEPEKMSAHNDGNTNSIQKRQQNTSNESNDKMELFKRELSQMIRKYGDNPPVDERSDIYSACATMYHLLTGQRPDICFHKQKPILSLVPSANEVFADILTRGLEQDPKKRYNSSAQFLGALEAMAKGSKRYKRLRFRQDLTLVLLFMLFAASMLSSFVGAKRKFEIRAEKAVETAYDMYSSGEYENTLEYLDENIYSFFFKPADSVLSDAYYIGGNCWLSQGDYDRAVTYYMQAILLDGSRAIYYRDYGIALVRKGELDRADECLLQAKAKGLSNDSLLLLHGEIDAASGNTDEAMEKLAECIDLSDDDVIRIRAALKLDELAAEYLGETEVGFETRIDILYPLTCEINGANSLPLISRLAQVYIDEFSFDQNTEHMENALELLDRIIKDGYGTLTELLDKSVCLQSLGKYDEARDCLLETAKKYPDDYSVYKRLAFIEIERQYELDADLRDYGDFKNWYDTCMTLYSSSKNTLQDMEINYLEIVYDEVVDKGWLTE